MRKLLVLGCLSIFLSVCNSLFATIITFDDLSPRQEISGTYYQGLYWESGNSGYAGVPGSWVSPATSDPSQMYYNFPQSVKNIANGFGCTEIGIQFLKLVDVSGAYFSAQGYADFSATPPDIYWSEKVRVHGYRNNNLAATTDWFTIDTSSPLAGQGPQPKWFKINLQYVDRIVIESNKAKDDPLWGKYGWYGMDDLTFKDTVVPEPTSLVLLTLGAILLHKGKK